MHTNTNTHTQTQTHTNTHTHTHTHTHTCTPTTRAPGLEEHERRVHDALGLLLAQLRPAARARTCLERKHARLHLELGEHCLLAQHPVRNNTHTHTRSSKHSAGLVRLWPTPPSCHTCALSLKHGLRLCLVARCPRAGTRARSRRFAAGHDGEHVPTEHTTLAGKGCQADIAQ